MGRIARIDQNRVGHVAVGGRLRPGQSIDDIADEARDARPGRTAVLGLEEVMGDVPAYQTPGWLAWPGES